MPKLIQIHEEVTACRECVYYRVEYHNTEIGCDIEQSCKKSDDKEIPDPSTIPSWCPLPAVPAAVDKRCGTCKWWEREDWPGSRLGKCHVSIVDHVPVWATVVGACSTGESSGAHCPAWEAKEK